MKSHLVFFFCLGWARLVSGQTAAGGPPPLPEGPLLKRTPEFSNWTVVTQVSGGASESGQNLAAEKARSDPNKPSPAQRATITKTGRIIYEQLVDAAGRKSEVWHNYGVRLAVPAAGGSPVAFPDYGGGDIYTPNYAVTDFAGLEWISPKTYTDIKKVMGRDCLIFRGEVNIQAVAEQREVEQEANRAHLRAAFEAREKGAKNPPATVAAPATGGTKVPAVACIDLETRLPIVVTFGKEMRLYQYGEPPTAMLTLPAALAAAHGEYQRKIQGLARLPAAP